MVGRQASLAAHLPLIHPNYYPAEPVMDDIRYGIFLRPDPATCWAVTRVTLALRQQFGIVAASAFAPHATLIGNLKVTISENELVAALGPAFRDTPPFPVYNAGVRTAGHSVRFDIDLDERREHPNTRLHDLAGAIRQIVAPLHVNHEDVLAPNVDDYRFGAHLTLAGFDLDVEPRLLREVAEFTRGLPLTPPASFVARWFSLFEFRADWSGPWWHDMQSRHITSWELTS
jgi:hypothetical protein